MKPTVIIILLMFGVLKCENVLETQVDYSAIVGAWNWVKTDGGVANQIHESPYTTGYSYLIIFSDNYQVSIIRSGNEVFSGNFQIEKRKSIYSGKLEDFIIIPPSDHITGMVISGIIAIDGNELTISDNCYDGIGSQFVKID